MAKLTVRKIETAKGPAKLTDEHGLYLRVSPRGMKSWIQRLNIQGLRTDNALGQVEVDVAESVQLGSDGRPAADLNDASVRKLVESTGIIAGKAEGMGILNR